MLAEVEAKTPGLVAMHEESTDGGSSASDAEFSSTSGTVSASAGIASQSRRASGASSIGLEGLEVRPEVPVPPVKAGKEKKGNSKAGKGNSKVGRPGAKGVPVSSLRNALRAQGAEVMQYMHMPPKPPSKSTTAGRPQPKVPASQGRPKAQLPASTKEMCLTPMRPPPGLEDLAPRSPPKAVFPPREAASRRVFGTGGINHNVILGTLPMQKLEESSEHCMLGAAMPAIPFPAADSLGVASTLESSASFELQKAHLMELTLKQLQESSSRMVEKDFEKGIYAVGARMSL
eukprot:TRINITY_DN29796_c0_g2_i1.p1 TRINITY_DN29796_c0_g2~~TRINITY_DN29796_c0_g2_i1.p1  ORF type:complete len:289 (+),score=70.91 TRINITY_DN29796_c0_g2_i1:133-999(+)